MELCPTYSHTHVHMQQTTPNVPSAGGYQSQAAPQGDAQNFASLSFSGEMGREE